MNTRIQKIVDAVKKNGHDGIVISKGSDIKYLTGFTGEYGVAVLLLTEKKNYGKIIFAFGGHKADVERCPSGLRSQS